MPPTKDKQIKTERVRRGSVPVALFGGLTLTYDVAFATPFPSGVPYVVTYGCEVNLVTALFNPQTVNPTENGFTITLAVAAAANLVAVKYRAELI